MMITFPCNWCLNARIFASKIIFVRSAPSFKLLVSLGFVTSCYVIFSLSMDPYQFLSACFRNLTNAINSAYYQTFTMRNVWESVVSETWRGSPFILTGHTMQPDRILNRILIGYFFLEGKCQNLILFNQNHFKRGVRYCFEI